MLQVLQQLVGDNLTEAQLRAIATQTMAEGDVLDHDGRISFCEFEQVLARTDLDAKLFIHFDLRLD